MGYLFFIVHALAASAAMVAQPQTGAASSAAPEAGWRSVTYPNAGELRYRLPQVTDRDYPPAARDAGIEGTTVLRLEVDPQGQIIDCRPARSVGDAGLDEAACRIYRTRARFKLRNIPQKIVLHAPVVWRLEPAVEQRIGQDPPGRPAELLQSKRCRKSAPAAASLKAWPLSLVAVDSVPECLAPAFRDLADRALAIAGDPKAKVVVRARVGRDWSEASMHYALPGSAWIRQPADIAPIIEFLSSEWEDYTSRDGELGWSGFLLVVADGRIQVRFLTNEPHLRDIAFNAKAIDEEFFPGLVFKPEEPAR